MKLSFQPQLTFKAIKLNESEKKRSDELLQNLTKSSDNNSDVIKFQLYELYDKHLEKEVNLKTKGYHLKEDFAQEMFLKFFETLENIQKKITPVEQFIPILNKIKPTKDELKSGIAERSISKNFNDTNLALENLLTDSHLPQYASTKNDEEIAIIQKNFNELINDSCLNNIENRILIERGKGKSFSNIGDEIGLSPNYARVRYYKAVAKIQDKNGILPENFDNFAENLKNTYKLKNDVSEIKKVLINYPPLLNINTQLLKSNIENSANTFGISESEFVEAGLMNLLLFTSKSETLKDHIKKSANVLKISEPEFIKMALKWPPLFNFKSETLKSNIENSANALGISEPEFIKAALKFPNLITLKSETLKSNVEKSASVFEISESEFIKAALKRPVLFALKNETLKSNVENSANALGISEPEFIKAALIQPSIFYIKSETLKSNIENSANTFGISEPEFIKAALKCKNLFIQATETLNNNIIRLAELINTNKSEVINLALTYPPIFTLEPETSAKRINIINYYRQIRNEKTKKLTFTTNSTEQIFKNIISYFVKQHYNNQITQKNFIEYIKSNPNEKYTFKLPQSEFNDEFIAFTENFLKTHTGKCNVSFVIAKE